MPNFVRVRDKRTKHEYTINERSVTDDHTVLDEPACDQTGRPRKATPHASAKKAAPARTPETITSEEL